MISSLRAKLTLLVAAGAFVAALTTFLVGGDVVRGTASIGTEFTATYPDACADLQNAAADCSLCHAPVPALNGYGADLAAAINDFAAIEGEDSDGDGATNIEEIEGCSLPGDPASTPPIPLTVGIDMDPTGNSCPGDGVTDCTLGEIDACLETTAGATIQFDVFLDGIPAGDSYLGAGYLLDGWPGTLQDPDAFGPLPHGHPNVNLTTQGPGSMAFDLSDALPDGSPPWTANIADLFAAEYNPPFTKGVVGRYALDLTGVAPGVYPMTLSSVAMGRDVPPGGDLCGAGPNDPGCEILDGNSSPPYGLIAVDEPCPGVEPTEADLKKVTLEALGLPDPPEIPVSEDVYFELHEVLHNNGPADDVAAETVTICFPPEDGECSYVCEGGEMITVSGAVVDPNCQAGAEYRAAFPDFLDVHGAASLPVSVPLDLQRTWDVHCSEPSTHTWHFENYVVLMPDGLTDPDESNNSLALDITLDCIAEADVKITGQQWLANDCNSAAPAEISINTDVDFCLQKVLHNNGGFGPVDVDITSSAQAPPAGCSITPDPTNPTTATLPVSLAQTVDELWTVNCDNETSKTFTVDNSIAVSTAHVVDPNTGNNSASSDLTVDVVVPVLDADLKVNDHVCNLPAGTIDVSSDVSLECAVLVHNNGPEGPVQAQVAVDVVASPDCTVIPSNVTATATVAVSVAQVVDMPPVTVHCDQPSSHELQYTSEVVVTEPGVIDPDPENNGLGPTPLGFVAIAEADVEITGQSLDAPNQLAVSESVPVTLTKVLHNNGPYGPVDVSVAATPVVPPDCTADPVDNPTSASLPVSVPIQVGEVWLIHCAEPSDHQFEFGNSITVTTPHVVDPDLANNDLATTHFVPVIALADVKIVGQSLISPPSEILTNTDVQVTLRKTLHNNGGYGPVDVFIDTSADLAQAPGCTANGDFVPSASLPVSADVQVDEVWTINCSEEGEKTFDFKNSISLTEPHIEDPDEANNAASTPLTVTAVPPGEPQADVKIVDAACSVPPEIAVSEEVVVDCLVTIHNNGPDPIDAAASLFLSATAPPDCDGTTGLVVDFITMPVSVDLEVPASFPIHCSEPSFHTFEFSAELSSALPDPDPSNNSATASHTVAAIAEADVKVTGMEVSGPPDILVSEDVNVTVRTTLHNNGPYGPVTVDLGYSADWPADCNVATVGPFQLSLPVSVDVNDDHIWTVHCKEPSTHLLEFQTEIVNIKEPHVVDPNPGNNSGSALWEVNVASQADVKIVAQGFMDPPTEIETDTDVDVVLRKTLHNNGPYGPVEVLISTDATADAGCTATPDPANPALVLLPVSANVEVDEVWTINCSETGDKTFTLDNSIEQQTVHVFDPDETNNSWSTPLTVTVVPPGEPEADVKIVDWTCSMPPEIPVSEEVVAECLATIHNNGPEHIEMGAYLFVIATAPPDCQVPPGLYFDFITMPVSVSMEIPVTFRVHCTEPSLHTIEFSAELGSGLPDPDPTNNSATSTHAVAAIGEADVKVTSMEVSGPTEILVSEDVDVTVRTTLHNNGPYGPVSVDLGYFGVLPDDCDIATVGPLQISLPVSVDVNDDHIWTIHCGAPSTHTFTFQTEIVNIKEPHVVDPNPNNNSGSTELSLDVASEADVKIVGQDFVDPPAEVEVGKDFELTLRKALHNNGPYGPVDVDIFWVVGLPPGCSFQSWSGPESATLPVSVDVSVDEIYTINCHELGPQTITAHNSIELQAVHVTDPDQGNNSWSSDVTVEVVEPGVIEVEIDIKPGSFPNSINVNNRGVIPVAILTTEDFDALMVDAETVLFGPAGATKIHKWAHAQDVDGDGDMDLVLHFRTRDTGIAAGDTEACITGQTYDGMPIVGCDSVRTVP